MRWPGWVLVGMLLLAGMPTATPQRPQNGDIRLPQDLTVGPGETFVVHSPARLDGPGRLIVEGRLEMVGDPASPILVNTTILLRGAGPHAVRDAVFAGQGARVQATAGELILADVTFRDGVVGVEASGTASLRAERVQFLSLDDAGLTLSGSASATLAKATLQSSATGIRASGNGSLGIDGATFRINRDHLAIDAAPGWRGEVHNATFASSLDGRPAILARGPATSSLRLDSSLVRNASLGLRAEGGVRIDGARDTFLENGVAIDVDGSVVTLTAATFAENGRVWQGAPEPTLTDSTFLSASTPAAVILPAPQGSGTGLATMALVGLVALAILGGAAVTYARRTTPPPPAAAPVESVEPVVAPAPQPDVSAPLRPQERRILADILANPGTPQSAVADRLGLSRQALHYHVKKLETRGLVTKVARGRETHCYVRAGTEALLDAPVAPQGDEATA